MNNKTSIWGWTLYTDFFLGALGGGLLILASLSTIFLGPEFVNASPFVASVIIMGVGAILLIAELGVPLRAWRVFTNPRSFLTMGATLMTVSLGFGILLASFYFQNAPWRHLTGIQNILAFLAILTGLGVAFYPGLLLGMMTGRPFWKGPLLAPLFLLSGLSTGIAAFCLLGQAWPVTENEIYGTLTSINIALIAAQVLGWSSFVIVKKSVLPPRENSAWKAAFEGTRSMAFWIGFMALGLVIPFVIYMPAGNGFDVIAHVLVLLGAFIMRGFVVTADRGPTLGF